MSMDRTMSTSLLGTELPQDQQDEIQVLESIYSHDFLAIINKNSYSLKVMPEGAPADVLLSWTYSPNYPTTPLNSFEVIAPWLTDQAVAVVSTTLKEMWAEGESVIFRWAEWLHSELVLHLRSLTLLQSPVPRTTAPLIPVDVADSTGDQLSERYVRNSAPLMIVGAGGKASYRARAPVFSPDAIVNVSASDIVSGEPISDRKSKFQAHAARVFSEADVAAIVHILKSNPRIAEAAHNITAFRVPDVHGEIVEGRDDDGETGAGDKMLFLLHHADVRNIVVVISRWYGGVHLGPDRFKHITNLTKEVLETMGLIGPKKDSESVSAITVPAARAKLQSANEILSRLRWDGTLDVADYTVVIEHHGECSEYTVQDAMTVENASVVRIRKGNTVIWDLALRINAFTE